MYYLTKYGRNISELQAFSESQICFELQITKEPGSLKSCSALRLSIIMY